MDKRELALMRSEQKIQFFLSHGELDWAVEELRSFASADRPQLAAATLDLAAKNVFERPDYFEEWMGQALALEPVHWSSHVGPWARAIAELSIKPDPNSANSIEDLIAAAPAVVHMLPVEPGGPSAREWMDLHVADMHGRWMEVLDALSDAGYAPDGPLKKRAKTPGYELPERLVKRGREIEDLIDHNWLQGAWAELADSDDEDKAPLALHTLYCAVHPYVHEPSDHEAACNAEDWLDRALQASPEVVLALVEDWAAALQELARIRDDEPRARAMFDQLANRATPEMLATRRGDASLGERMSRAGGPLAALASRVAAMAERDVLLASAAPTPLGGAIEPARAIPPRL